MFKNLEVSNVIHISTLKQVGVSFVQNDTIQNVGKNIFFKFIYYLKSKLIRTKNNDIYKLY